LNDFRKAIALLNRRERVWLVLLVVASIAMGAMQVAGVGSIIPVLSLLGNPDAWTESAPLRRVHDYLGFDTDRAFLIFIGSTAVGVVVLSNLFQASMMWLISRFIWHVHARLSTELLSSYLLSPYTLFLDRNTSDLRKNVLQEVERFAGDVIGPVLSLCTFGITILFLVGFLFWLNPIFAGLSVIFLGGGYVLLFLVVRLVLKRAGAVRIEADALRHKLVAESMDGIKETKVLGTEATFIARFEPPNRASAGAKIKQQVLGQVPKYAIEAFAFGSVLVGAIYFVGIGSGLRDLVAVIGVYAFAGYRLLPAVHNVYLAWSTVRFNQAVSEVIHRDLRADHHRPARLQVGRPGPRESLPFHESIKLDNVTFSYPRSSGPALDAVSLSISKGACVAFVGETGAGKTTAADVILGLFIPQTGRVRVDGVALEDEVTVRKWQNNVGYVPQEIFLVDDTIAANIAFGIPAREIDMGAVEAAARVARIDGFVTDQLPLGYQTVVGERGVRMSGGQRQRVGIARALYRNPAVLVLDEATSDLDVGTESLVHEAIMSVRGNKTVIIIAHRLSVTRECDRLFVFQRGRVVAEGRYDQIVTPSGSFAARV